MRSAARLIRRFGGNLMRRFGMVPEGTPDGLGEDATLKDARLEQQVMVFFPDTRTNLYQLRQWYEPLRALHRTQPVVIVVQDSRVGRDIRAETDLPVVVIGRSAALDRLVSRSEVKLVLYVGHLSRNFLALRHGSMVHVYLGHGESDKEISVSNQIKAYDFCFVAGQAAVDRITAGTIFYDVEHRLIRIGRPQLDVAAEVVPSEGRPTVLYAPTWEGAQPSVAYGSVVTHAAPLVAALLAADRFRVVYRPHPRSGANEVGYAEADRAVRKLVEVAAARQPEVGHRVDTSVAAEAALAAADMLVCDVSALAWDWLPSGKPLVVTLPAAPTARVAQTALLEVVPRLAADAAGSGAEVVSAQLSDDPSRQERLALVEYYFGDTTPGASTRRFVAACTDVIAARDRAVAARTGSIPVPDVGSVPDTEDLGE